MRTLYIDVYFLINLTVDILSLYFSAVFSKSPTSTKRLIITGIFCALFASFTVLFTENPILVFFLSVIPLVFVGGFATKKISPRRKIKFVITFVVFEALVGGVFSFVWGILDKYVYTYLSSQSGNPVNRKMLLFSLIILLSIGVFKMLVSFFSNIESEGVCEIEICFLGKSFITEAFVDSGNLAMDPMDMRPVVLVKKEAAEKFMPKEVLDLRDPDSLSRETRKRIRLIPISRGGVTHVLTGVRADGVFLLGKNVREEISVTVAIDKEGGSFGGYYALLPSSVVGNAFNK